MHSNKTGQSSFRACDCIPHSSFDRLWVVVVALDKPFLHLLNMPTMLACTQTDIHGGYAQHIMYRPTVALTLFAGLVEKQTQLHHVLVYISKFSNCYNSFG